MTSLLTAVCLQLVMSHHRHDGCYGARWACPAWRQPRSLAASATDAGRLATRRHRHHQRRLLASLGLIQHYLRQTWPHHVMLQLPTPVWTCAWVPLAWQIAVASWYSVALWSQSGGFPVAQRSCWGWVEDHQSMQICAFARLWRGGGRRPQTVAVAGAAFASSPWVLWP